MHVCNGLKKFTITRCQPFLWEILIGRYYNRTLLRAALLTLRSVLSLRARTIRSHNSEQLLNDYKDLVWQCSLALHQHTQGVDV